MSDEAKNHPTPNSPTPKEKFAAAAASRDPDMKEEKLWSGGYSAKAMYGTWLGVVLLSVLLIVATVFQPDWWVIFIPVIALAWLAVSVVLAYRKLAVSYELTTQRFVHSEGIFSRRTDRIEVIDIDDVTFTQGLIQRMLGVGKIEISSSDRSHPNLLLPGIDDVAHVAELIDNIRRQERRRRGLHIEAI